MSRTFGLELHIVLLGPGPLTAAFRRYGHVHQLSAQDGAEAAALARKLTERGVAAALCNSIASGLFVGVLARAGIRCVSLVHELPALIAERNFMPHADAIRAHAAVTVFPAEFVRDKFPGGAPTHSRILPQGLSKRRGAPDPQRRREARQQLSKRHAIPETAPVALNCGYGDARKGIDLFVAIGAAVMSANAEARFVWVGGIEPGLDAKIHAAAAATGFGARFIFAPFSADLSAYYDGADIFALTSREDPYPTVLLEAQDTGVPAVAFEGAGGFGALAANGGVTLTAHGDASAFAQTLLSIISAPDLRQRMSTAASQLPGLSMRSYAFELARLIAAAPPRVSVIVPNYNYAHYLRARLRSILDQTLPPFEIIFLDDCSTDESLRVARETLRGADIDVHLIAGEAKASSVFAQWRRGVSEAKGDLVWIAEADDLSDPRFLATCAQAFADPSVVMSYTQSRQIDAAGRVLDADYLTYVSDIDADRWRTAHTADGMDEIRGPLAVKNTIPNVSACLFRKTALLSALDTHFEDIARFTIAGDWITYIRTLTQGRIAFDPTPLNRHRRHQRSVTASALPPETALAEIARIQELVRSEFAPDAEVRARAAAYLETLRRQFGLAG